jgi:hypothetical protein
MGAGAGRRYAEGVRRYFTPRCIGMHVTLLIILPVFIWLTAWQFGRAVHGNTLSWAYTFEWPLFLAYAVYVWWQLIHDEPTALQRRRTAARAAGQAPGPQDEVGWALNAKGDRPDPIARHEAPEAPTPEEAFEEQRVDEEEDPELAAYNRYLAELNAGPDPRRW